jgi:hypothetical protein
MAGLLHVKGGTHLSLDDHSFTQNGVQGRLKTNALYALVNRTDLGGRDVFNTLHWTFKAALLLAVKKHVLEEAKLVLNAIEVGLVRMYVGGGANLEEVGHFSLHKIRCKLPHYVLGNVCDQIAIIPDYNAT